MQIIDATRWRRFLLSGYRGVTQTRTRSAVDRIRLKYVNANRLLATVVLSEIGHDDAANRLQTKIAVDPASRCGWKLWAQAFRRNNCVRTCRYFRNTASMRIFSREGAADLRDYLQEQGYYDATVQFRETRKIDGATEIDYIVERGIRHRFVHWK